MSDDVQICVSPLASPYSILPRAHTYALIAALIIPLPQGWLFRAALAAFTTRTAVFVIDAIVILHDLRRREAGDEAKPYPLDAFVVLEVLALAALVACWLLLVSRRGRRSSARPLIRVWGVVVLTGAVLAFIAVAKIGHGAALARLGDGPDCAGVLVDRANVFGDKTTAPVLGTFGSKALFFENRVGIPGLVLAVLALIGVFAPNRAQTAQKKTDIEANSDVIVDGSRRGSEKVHSVSLHVLILIPALPAVAIFVVVSAEQYFNAMVSGFPSVESMTSPGQWGIWAATGVVLLATMINAVREQANAREIGQAGQPPAPDGDNPEVVKL